MNPYHKTPPAALLAILFLQTTVFSVLADKTWNTNNGNWGDPQSWSSPGLPSAENVAFGNTAQSTNPTVNVSVSGSNTIDQLLVDYGKTVNLNF